MTSIGHTAWWRHQMETFSALLTICAGNSPVTGDFPAQRPVTRGFDVFFGLRLNKRLSKQSHGWWFETPSSPLWCHCNGQIMLNSLLRKTFLRHCGLNKMIDIFQMTYSSCMIWNKNILLLVKFRWKQFPGVTVNLLEGTMSSHKIMLTYVRIWYVSMCWQEKCLYINGENELSITSLKWQPLS